MKHLKLIINNKEKKIINFFNKEELQTILNLYAYMVSNGEWKDYGLNISKTEVSFNVYKRASEFPVYRIAKKLNPKYKNGTYIIKDSLGNILRSSENLRKLIQDMKREKLKLVN